MNALAQDWRKWLAAVLALVLLGGVFALYLLPDLRLALSQLMWSCLAGMSQ